MKKKQNLYMDEFTGEIVTVKKNQIKGLPYNVKRIKFKKNKQGKDAMIFELAGAIIEVTEREAEPIPEPEIKEE